MEELLQTVRNLKNKAKNRRDLGRYETAANTLKEGAIPLLQQALPSAPDSWTTQLVSELSDCLGILGGVYRRWALESKGEDERASLLNESVKAYNEGYEWERKHGLANSYNALNRLVSYILLEPQSLSEQPADLDVRQELGAVEALLAEQLKEKRRGDIWALADYALASLLLDRDDPVSAYAEFTAKSPPDFAYESALSTLRPLAELQTPVAEKLKKAVSLLEAKLRQLQAQ